MMNIKVSIIIPIYNGEEYLEECLKSVLLQDIKEKEVICVDDGSTDNTLEIIRKYQYNNSEIKLITQKNQGAAIARNKALDIAQGDYIAFMDADDYYLDTSCLRKMIEVCEKTDIPICGSYRMIVKDKEVYSDGVWRKEFEGILEAKKFQYIDYQYDYNYQSYIFKKNFLDEHLLRFPDLRRYQDPPFFMKAMWYASEFMVLPIEMYAYRARTVPMKYSFRQANDTLKGILHNLKFAKENNLWILYDNCVKRLNHDFYNVLMETITNGNLIALKYLIEISECLEEKASESDCLKVLQKMKYTLFESRYIFPGRYQFPYSEIELGSLVAVYGAGKVGKEIVKKIQSMNYCTLVVWVDKNYALYKEQGLEVHNPEFMLQKDFDYVLVAVESEDLFEEIKNNLIERNWNKGRKIIGPVIR